MKTQCKLGVYAGLVRFTREEKVAGMVIQTGGPDYLVVLPGSQEVIARIGRENSVEKVSDGIILKPKTIYYLYTEDVAVAHA